MKEGDESSDYHASESDNHSDLDFDETSVEIEEHSTNCLD
jgi:hypothetical protein